MTAIVSGSAHKLALTSDGQVTAWGGQNYYGEATVPASLAGKMVTAVAAGELSSMALTSDGEIVVWGQLGRLYSVPGSLAGKTVTAISIGLYNALALTSDGTVTAWGDNSMGGLNVPASLTGKTVTAIATGYQHNLALTSDGTVTGWGGGSYGAQTAPAGLQHVTSIAAGRDHSLAVYQNALVVSGSVAVSGTPTVGETLTADSTVTTLPSAPQVGQWLRDGIAVAGATGATYVLTDADAGTTLSYRVTASTAGFSDAVVTSGGVGPVDGGTITLPTPTVDGSAVVDGTLTASLPGAVEPADATVDYSWTRGLTRVGTGNTYTPTAADIGYQLSVTATAHKPHFDEATATSAVTAAVTQAVFTTGPTASVAGTLKVGQTLTAGVGAATPAPDGYTYQWSADGTPVPSGDGATFTLTAAQLHRSITVQVTALRAGYTSMSHLSTPTADVATDLAPTLDLTVAKASLRRGQSTTLTWTSQEASTLSASQGWTGAPAAAGTATVHPTALGSTTYVLSATNANGTTTAQVNVLVTREAKKLPVAASNGLRLRGTRIRVVASGLDPAERYTIRIKGIQVATGTATNTGQVDRLVTIPTRIGEGGTLVAVTGSAADRTGADTIRVVTNKRLSLTLAKTAVRASDRQRYTVRGLAAGETVTVTYQGRRISGLGAHADRHGAYTATFDVKTSWGSKTVKVTGQFTGRNASRTFQVVRRCTVGHICR